MRPCCCAAAVNSCSTAVEMDVPPPEATSSESRVPVELTTYTADVWPVRSACLASTSSLDAEAWTGSPATALSWSASWPARPSCATTITGIWCGDGEWKAPM